MIYFIEPVWLLSNRYVIIIIIIIMKCWTDVSLSCVISEFFSQLMKNYNKKGRKSGTA